MPAPNPFLQQTLDRASPSTFVLQEGLRVFGGRFVLQRHLGQGGMGQVWLAQDTSLDQQRALKFVLPALLSDATARKRLRNEARLGTELAHPRIVRVFDFVEETTGEPLAAVVMEYVQGRTLSELLAEKEDGFLEPEEIERWVQDVSEGLRYAHEEKQRFHLDLKPGNIIIETATGRAKLLDFGISRSAKDTMTRLTGQMSSGTLPYMSPQQLDGEAPCAADDVYGLGATVYELLTGTPPFFRGKLDDQIRIKVPESLMERRRQNAKEGLNAGVGRAVPIEWENRVRAMLDKSIKHRGLLIDSWVAKQSPPPNTNPASQVPRGHPAAVIAAQNTLASGKSTNAPVGRPMSTNVLLVCSFLGLLTTVFLLLVLWHHTEFPVPFQFGENPIWEQIKTYENFVILGAGISLGIFVLSAFADERVTHAKPLDKTVIIGAPLIAACALLAGGIMLSEASDWRNGRAAFQFAQGWPATDLHRWLDGMFAANVVACGMLGLAIVVLFRLKVAKTMGGNPTG